MARSTRNIRTAIRRLAMMGVAGVAMASPAHAQDFSAWFEGGKQTVTLGNGLAKDGIAAGAGFQLIVGGGAKKNSGVVVPVGFALQKGAGTFGLVFSGDVGFRVHNIAFGPGVTFSLTSRSFVEDATCDTTLAQSSCVLYTSGQVMRDLGGFLGFTPSGYVKLNFGPQGRAFLQVRYFSYLPGATSFLSDSEQRDAFNGLADLFGSNAEAVQTQVAFHPVDFPEFDGGRDLRVSVGYALGGRLLLRGQYTDQRYHFTRDLGNLSGIFDQHAKQFTVGLGIR
jgi:hypothetical protein